MWKALMVTKKKHPYIIHMKEKAYSFITAHLYQIKVQKSYTISFLLHVSMSLIQRNEALVYITA